MAAQFIINPHDKYFAFTFVSESENIILFSRLFKTLEMCKGGIKELLGCITSYDHFEKLQDNKGQYSFVVCNKKGIPIGHSPIFYASSTRDVHIRKLVQEAVLAKIVVEAAEV